MEQEASSMRLDHELYQTPSWAVALVCSVFVIVSIAAQRSIHVLGNWLKRTRRKPLFHTLEKIRNELMVLGFISLVLTLTKHLISGICVDSKFYNRQPTACKRKSSIPKLYSVSYGSSCLQKGMEPFVSYESLEQFHWFIFALGTTHIVYSCSTMLLSLVKIYSWISWEKDAHSENHDSLADIMKNLQLTPDKNRFLLWVECFFKQFGKSVTKFDYLTLRLGFILNHGTSSSYDFHSYLIRTIENDFQKIVGISEPLWMFVIFFMLINVHGLNLYFWFAFLPVVLLVAVGAKMQHVIATLSLENAGIRGSHNNSSKPRDALFWFNKPELLLNLMHFILFQNAFELATFFWTLGHFGQGSCLIANKKVYVYTRVTFGLSAQLLCSYSTLPLYALVTQMGSSYKKTIFQESVMHSLNAWRKSAQQKSRQTDGQNRICHAGVTEGVL